jgi:hypothetical protein
MTMPQHITVHSTGVLLYPPYYPGLKPIDLYLFLWLKNQLKGCYFKDAAEKQVALDCIG